MLLTIYDKGGAARAEISANDSSTQQKEVQGDNVLALSFTHYDHIALDVDWYTDFEGERYWLTERYAPKQKNEAEWEYDVKLYGIESLIKRFLVLETTDGDEEPVFTLTATPREHVSMVVKSINNGMNHTTDWKVGQVDGTEMVTIDYEGKFCDAALKEIAEKVGGKAEWWTEGQTVNVCRCEHGEELTLGYRKGLTEIERDTSNTEGFYTRLFPIGSSRNIDPEKYGHSRLMLPGGKKSVELHTDEYGIHDRYEKDAFSGIFPRRTGTVSSVRSEDVTDDDGNDFTIYYFKDESLNFDPNDYELAGETKRVSFKDGNLNGLGTGDDHYFEVNFDSDTREFEIITTWPYDDGTQLPGGQLVPKAGDHYILWNIRMPDEYYPIAEDEFAEAVEKYNEEHWRDLSVYKGATNHVWIEDNGVDLYVGRRVRLESKKYFPETGYRSSRITKITRKVNLPSQMDIEISDALQTGTLERVNDDMTNLRNYVRQTSASSLSVVRSWENTPASDYNIASYKMVLKQIASRALSRLQPDEAKGLIKFLSGFETGTYAEGLSGGKIDAEGNAELGGLLTRLKATLAELQVNGPSTFLGNLSSEEFVSGFLGGKGWSIFKTEVLNALGVPEAKYTGEFDNLIVRGSLRVFEMIISQLLGENDNRVFTGMMEVDHYDAETGRVYLATQDGKLYNPFREHDYIMVQQYNGMPDSSKDYYVTRHYELVVTGAGCGSLSDGENRLDWVTFKNFVSADGKPAADVISKGDTFVRVDNAQDPDRKGIIQLMTVGNATPYMDVLYGLKTDPDNALKGRIGNIDGIRHHLFGWLSGFGQYLINLYAVGDFRLRRTGESLDAKIEMLKAMFATQYQRTAYDITEEDNYLKNATFTESMEFWESENESSIITSNGEALLMNGSTYTATGRTAAIEEQDGRNMLHLRDSLVSQKNVHIRKPGTHKEYVPPTPNNLSGDYVEVKDTLYLSVKFLAKTGGTLTVGFQGASSETGSLPCPVTLAVTGSMDWQSLQWSGTWDGAGDFILQYTGEMYVSLLSLTDKALDDYRKETSTHFEQTDSNIRLLGTNIDNLKGTVTQLGIDMDAANERISIYATKTDSLENSVTKLGIRLDAAESDITLYAGKVSENASAIAAIRIRTDSIESSVSGAQSDILLLSGRIDTAQESADAAQSSADQVRTSVSTLNTYIDGAFADGIITEAESIAIEKYLNTVRSVQDEMDAAYAKLYANTYLEGTAKSGLLSAKSSLDTAVGGLISAINLAISDGKATAAEKKSVDDKFAVFNSSVAAFQTAVETANKAIQDKLKSFSDDAALLADQARQLAISAAEAETYSQSSNPWRSWASGTECKHVGAVWHNTSDGHTYRYIGYDNTNTWEDITDIQSSASYVLQNKDKISTVVASFDANGNLTNTSGLVTTSYASQIYATKGTVDSLGNRMTTAEASIDVHSTQISMRVEKDGVISAINQSSETVQISASKIKLEGYTTINNSFSVDVNGTTHIGGFKVSGNGLTNDPFTNDAYIIFRNDAHKAFAGIGGNVLPASSGVRAVARFENHDEADWWSLGMNYAMVVSARGARGCRAIQMDGGTVSGFAMQNTIIDTSITSQTLTRYDYNVIAINTAECTLTLPTMQLYDDGHVIRIKRLGTTLKVKLGYCYTYNGESSRYSKPCLIYNQNNTLVGTSTLSFDSVCDAFELVWCRDITRTIGDTIYYGAWIQYKLPRDW